MGDNRGGRVKQPLVVSLPLFKEKLIVSFFLGRFTEDGSFIGQYGPGSKKQQEDQQSPSAIATYV